MISKPRPISGDTGSSYADGTVVVGVDGTSSGLAALTEAVADAVETHARVVCVHVRAEPMFAEMMVMMAPYAAAIANEWRDALELEAWLQCAQVVEPHGLKWDFQVSLGRPAEALDEIAAARHASAIYVGARRRGGWARRLHRCPALELARSCHCPVRLVAHAADDSPQL
ncbi:universal stress protein [Thermopolyspora sp. NPDC052614]|uniref:universal stress protein n=1 Tax=Thermopolyspora sp. NPDC052614 TaxID=3155682 RepID=UPI00344AE191